MFARSRRTISTSAATTPRGRKGIHVDLADLIAALPREHQRVPPPWPPHRHPAPACRARHREWDGIELVQHAAGGFFIERCEPTGGIAQELRVDAACADDNHWPETGSFTPGDELEAAPNHFRNKNAIDASVWSVLASVSSIPR